MKLVALVDALLDLLDSEPDYRFFTLDGQTVVLQDYLEIRPENRERLARHIREGRVLIGPWYVLPDEFLPSGEALLRNLLLGKLVAEPFGDVMPVGYLPDTFGHPAQMPQILRGFGIDNTVVYRGLQTDDSEFIWEAPDGSTVLGIYLPEGYWNAVQVSIGPQRFLDRAAQAIEGLEKRAPSGNVLLMNGIDHLTPLGGIERTIARANQSLTDGASLRQGTLPDYIERVKAANPPLKTLRGEFRSGRPARITPGVISARMYVKLANFKSEVALEKYAEPLSALAWLTGSPYPDAFLWQAWTYLLQNHPHDSICGCSVDEVHRDMESRFRWSQEIAEDLTIRGLETLAGNIDVSNTGDCAALVTFNPLGQKRADCCYHYLHFLEPGRAFHLKNTRGQTIPHQIINRKPATLAYEHWTGRIELDGKQKPTMVAISKSERRAIRETGLWQKWEGEEVELLALPGDIPACGFTTLSVTLGQADMPQTDLRKGPDYLENDLVRVTVNADGTLDLHHKRTATTYRALNKFQSGGDCGDEYTYCPPKKDGAFISCGTRPRVTLIEQGPVRATFELQSTLNIPKGLTEDRSGRSAEHVSCPVTMRVSLCAHSPRVEVQVALTNVAKDQVLRVLFPTPLQTEWAHSLGQFEMIERPVRLPQEELDRVPGPEEEAAVNTYPHHTLVDVNDGQRGLAILSRGLTEYEALPGDEGVSVALTLLRSVGWLSRGDLPTRYGHAGPGLETPEAQCLGDHVFEWAMVPHAGDWSTAMISQEADRFAAPTRSVIAGQGSSTLPDEMSFVAVEPTELLMSTLKKAEKDDGLILRVYNTTNKPVLGRIHLNEVFKEAWLVNLAEMDVEDSPLSIDHSNTITLEVRGLQICSLKLKKN